MTTTARADRKFNRFFFAIFKWMYTLVNFSCQGFKLFFLVFYLTRERQASNTVLDKRKKGDPQKGIAVSVNELRLTVASE